MILVCGFGRCGSSLMMQMLHCGGVRCVGEWPSFEDVKATAMGGTIEDPAWVEGHAHHAAKLLDPQHFTVPAGNHYVIWLDRDGVQQGKSQAKFLRLLSGIPTGAREARAFAASYAKDRPFAMRSLRKAMATARPILSIRFEQLLNPSHALVSSIRDYLDRPELDIHAMAAAVRPRGPECQPGLEMELTLMSEGRAPTPERAE